MHVKKLVMRSISGCEGQTERHVEKFLPKAIQQPATQVNTSLKPCRLHTFIAHPQNQHRVCAWMRSLTTKKGFALLNLLVASLGNLPQAHEICLCVASHFIHRLRSGEGAVVTATRCQTWQTYCKTLFLESLEPTCLKESLTLFAPLRLTIMIEAQFKFGLAWHSLTWTKQLS